MTILEHVEMRVQQLTPVSLQEALLKVHGKHVKKKGLRTDLQSVLSDMWSISNPPDVLLDTKQSDDLMDAVNHDFTEDQLVVMYDMNIDAAAEYVYRLIQEK